jgi:hypothetical protein
LAALFLVGFLAVKEKQSEEPTIPDLKTIRIQSRTDYLSDLEHDLITVDLDKLDYELNLK